MAGPWAGRPEDLHEPSNCPSRGQLSGEGAPSRVPWALLTDPRLQTTFSFNLLAVGDCFCFLRRSHGHLSAVGGGGRGIKVESDEICLPLYGTVRHSDTPIRPAIIVHSPLGLLTGGPQCGMSNLRNPHVPCHYFFCYFHVDFKMGPYRMSILRNNICHVVYNFPLVKRPHLASRF